jgi:hypothetical protein
MKNCLIFNNFSNVLKNIMKPTYAGHPYSLRVFQQYQECNKRHCDLGDLNAINNQNKQTTFLYKTTFSKP